MSETGTGEKAGAAARHNGIASLVRQRGFMAIEALANHFDVTVQTIRRDLNLLAEEGRVLRYHGGAGLPSSIENIDYTARQVMNPAEKERIARLVAAEIPAHASLFINIGTTTEAVGEALLDHQELMVITNNINVANKLRLFPSIEVVIAGGVVRGSDGGIVGEAAVDFIRQFKVDYAVIGASAIDADGALLDFDFREVKVAQAIIANARHVILVADSTKFERTAPVRIGHLSQVHTFITDECPLESLRRIAAESNVRLIEISRTGGPDR
jgi:DeoR family glycerol-3-phosphate regulon repressor